MKRQIPFVFIILVALLFFALPVQAGGWAVITLSELPTQVVAGEPLTIEFAVRQHGVELTSNFGSPTVHARHAETGERLTVEGKRTTRQGYFTAELLFPQSGTWNWSIDIFNDPDFAQTMPPLNVQAGGVSASAPRAAAVSLPLVLGMIGLVAAVGSGAVFFATRARWALGVGLAGILLTVVGLASAVRQPVAAATALPPSSTSQVELGKALFLAKGCVVCHTHVEARAGYTGIQTDIGPDLTDTKLPAEYLSIWLKDPAAIKPETKMPNLELKESEMDALVAFLTVNQ